MISRRKRTLGPRRSSGLWFQVFAVETRSFLPDDQSDRRDPASQGETSHRRLHPLGQQTFVKLVQGPGGTAGPNRRALEDRLRSWLWFLFRPRSATAFAERRSWTST